MGKLIVKEELRKIAASQKFTDEELDELVINSVPSLWAEQYLSGPDNLTKHKPLELQKIQKDILDDPYPLKSIRFGRGCLPETEKVLTKRGNISIKDVELGELVPSKSGNQLVFKPVINKFINGKKDIYKITLENGLSLNMANSHPVLILKNTKPEYINIKQGLKIGDKVFYNKGFIHNSKKEDIELAKFLGYMLTDGSVTSTQTPKFTNTNYSYIEEVDNYVKNKFGFINKLYKKGNGWDLIFTTGIRNAYIKNKVSEFFKELGILGLKKTCKKIPNIIYTLNKKSIGYFINRLYAGDGHISYWKKNRGNENEYAVEIGFTTSSKELLNDLQQLLLIFGIYSKQSNRFRINKKTNITTENPVYELRIFKSESILNFFNLTDFIYGKEIQSKEIQKIALAKSKSRKIKLTDSFDTFPLSKIKSIEYIGKQETYDIEVKDTHNYIANGIITHNSGKSVAMVAYAFWECITEPGVNVYFYIPGKSQIERIYTVMENMLYNSRASQYINKESITKELLNKKEQIEHVVNFKNNSRIVFFICDQKIDKIRSHHNANAIIIDEAAAIKPEAITAIVGILTSSSGIMWGTSTPKGKIGWFYNWCLKEDVAHYHFKSSQAKHWNAAKELAARQACDTEAMYIQEFDAEFSDEAETIYPEKIIEAAVIKSYRHYGNIVRRDYKTHKTYLDEKQMLEEYYPQRKRLSIGIDWNDPTAGVRIAYLLETEEELVLLKVDKISHEKFTQIEAVNKIITIYTELRPDIIYADIGFGVTQCEMLYKWAEDNGDESFKEIFKAIDFNKILIFNEQDTPYKRNKSQDEEDDKYKVRTKNYMVSLTYKALKGEKLVLPVYEDKPSDKDGLIQELRSFKLQYIGVNGEPVYSKEGGQHSHFALGLAVFGINECIRKEGKPKQTSASYLNMGRTNYIGSSTKPERIIDPSFDSDVSVYSYSQKDFEMDRDPDTYKVSFNRRRLESRRDKLLD